MTMGFGGPTKTWCSPMVLNRRYALDKLALACTRKGVRCMKGRKSMYMRLSLSVRSLPMTLQLSMPSCCAHQARHFDFEAICFRPLLVRMKSHIRQVQSQANDCCIQGCMLSVLQTPVNITAVFTESVRR